MFSKNILDFQESTTILSAYTKKSGNLLKAPRTYTQAPSYKLVIFSNIHFISNRKLLYKTKTLFFMHRYIFVYFQTEDYRETFNIIWKREKRAICMM